MTTATKQIVHKGNKKILKLDKENVLKKKNILMKNAPFQNLKTNLTLFSDCDYLRILKIKKAIRNTKPY